MLGVCSAGTHAGGSRQCSITASPASRLIWRPGAGSRGAGRESAGEGGAARGARRMVFACVRARTRVCMGGRRAAAAERWCMRWRRVLRVRVCGGDPLVCTTWRAQGLQVAGAPKGAAAPRRSPAPRRARAGPRAAGTGLRQSGCLQWGVRQGPCRKGSLRQGAAAGDDADAGLRVRGTTRTRKPQACPPWLPLLAAPLLWAGKEAHSCSAKGGTRCPCIVAPSAAAKGGGPGGGVARKQRPGPGTTGAGCWRRR